MNDCERSVVLGIAGPTCSGKSALSDAIQQHEPQDVLVLHQDDYYRDYSGMSCSEIARVNFDRPDAIDMPLLARHVRGLRMGFTVKKPVYCRRTHRRIASESVVPHPIVVVEGLFVLGWPDIALELDMKVYLDADRDTIWKRRLRRDAAYGRTRGEMSGRFDEMAWPGHLRYVEPSKQLADFVVENPFDCEDVAAELCVQARERHEKLIPYSVMAVDQDA